MNGKGDKARQGVDWKRYRGNHDSIFRKNGESEGTRELRRLMEYPLSALGFMRHHAKYGNVPWPSGMGETRRKNE